MKERVVYVKSDGFAPKSFIEITEQEHFDLLYDNGILESTVIDEETEKAWTDIFFEINKKIKGGDFGYTTCKLTETGVSKEIHKIMQNVGNTTLFTLLNINTEDWLQRITEYLVYMERSIASIPGTVIYWMILKDFFEENGVVGSKSKQLLKYIITKNDVVFYHLYIDEILEFAESFPFKPLGIEKYPIHDVVSVLELYPQGKLNRYIAVQFPNIPKTLYREKIKELFHTHLEIALSDFKTEDLWEKGDADAIMKFLTDCTILENKLTKQEILQPENTEYTSIIKQWLQSQKKLISNLNEIQQIKLNLSKTTNETVNTTSETTVKPEIPKNVAKYYALYIRIQEQTGREIPFVKNDYGRFPRGKIEAFAKNRFPGISTLQFYNHYRDLEDMSDKVKIARSYPNAKEIVADIAKNDADVLFFLKEFPS